MRSGHVPAIKIPIRMAAIAACMPIEAATICRKHQEKALRNYSLRFCKTEGNFFRNYLDLVPASTPGGENFGKFLKGYGLEQFRDTHRKDNFAWLISFQPEKDTWEEVIELTDPEIHNLLRRLAESGWPVPEGGYELMNEQGEIIANTELGWPALKIAFKINCIYLFFPEFCCILYIVLQSKLHDFIKHPGIG